VDKILRTNCLAIGFISKPQPDQILKKTYHYHGM